MCIWRLNGHLIWRFILLPYQWGSLCLYSPSITNNKSSKKTFFSVKPWQQTKVVLKYSKVLSNFLTIPWFILEQLCWHLHSWYRAMVGKTMSVFGTHERKSTRMIWVRILHRHIFYGTSSLLERKTGSTNYGYSGFSMWQTFSPKWMKWICHIKGKCDERYPYLGFSDVHNFLYYFICNRTFFEWYYVLFLEMDIALQNEAEGLYAFFYFYHTEYSTYWGIVYM